jgi:DNA-binding response OmpR family regulator
MNQHVIDEVVTAPNVEPRTSSMQTVTLPGCVVDLAECEVRFADGERSLLSRFEAGLLQHLARNPGRVVSRDEILKCVWRLDSIGVVTRTIDMHVSKLRKKIRDDARCPAVLKTISRRGYVFVHNAGSHFVKDTKPKLRL